MYSSASMELSLFARMMRYEYVPMERLATLIGGADRLTILPAQQVSSTLVDSSRVVTFLVPLGATPGAGKGVLIFLIKDSVYQSLFQDAINGNVNTYILQDGRLLCLGGGAALSAGSRRRRIRSRDPRTFRQGRGGLDRGYLLRKQLGSVLQRGAAERGHQRRHLPPAEQPAGAAAGVCDPEPDAGPVDGPAARAAHPGHHGAAVPAGGGAPRDELQQISTGIRQLTTRNQELSSRLERALPVQRHDFVFRFVKGRFATREEAVAAGRAVGLETGRAPTR